MADQLIEEQIQEFREIFNLFDEDHDSRLSVYELGKMLNSLGQNCTEHDVIAMIQTNDVEPDEQNRIDFPDFLSLMARKMKDTDTEEDSRIKLVPTHF